jgi:hypothetical protein
MARPARFQILLGGEQNVIVDVERGAHVSHNQVMRPHQSIIGFWTRTTP